MEFRRLGNSGLIVSVVGLGTNNFGLKLDEDQTKEVIDAALEAGITLFDTADSYGLSEERIGKFLKGRRDDVVLATKFGNDVRRLGVAAGEDWGARGSRRYIRSAVEASLRRLQTDWIDLYQYHIPDKVTPIEETLSALDDLVREGKVRYIGTSNMTGWQVTEAEWVARTNGFTRFISAQNEYNWRKRKIEADLVPALEKYGIGLLPYYPLASGVLTGKYRRGEPVPEGSRMQTFKSEAMLTDRLFDWLDGVEKFAAEQGVSLLEIAIGGLAAKPAVGSVIAGATSAEQVKANVAAGQWRPTPEQLAELDKITA